MRVEFILLQGSCLSIYFINILDVIGKSKSGQRNSLFRSLIGKLDVVIINLVGFGNKGICSVLGYQKRLLNPYIRIDDLSQRLHFFTVLFHHIVGSILESCQIFHVHRSNNQQAFVLQNIGSCIPERMEVNTASIFQNDLL